MLGLGHVQRMLVLASTLRQDAEVTFVTQSDAIVRQRLAGGGYSVIAAEDGYEAALDALQPLDTVIVDRLEVGEALAVRIRRRAETKLAIFGNVSAANRHAHVVVNAVIGTRFENRRYRDAVNGTLYLEGPRYVMLGEAFRARRVAYVYTGRIDRILIIFGGSDQANLTCRAVQRLRKAGVAAELTVCVGAAYPHGEALERLAADAEREGCRLHIVRNSSAIADLMLDADFVLTSPGNSLFEALSLGVPALGFFQSTKQAEIFRGFPCCHEQDQIEEVDTLMAMTYCDYGYYISLRDSLAVGEGYVEIVGELERPLLNCNSQIAMRAEVRVEK